MHNASLMLPLFPSPQRTHNEPTAQRSAGATSPPVIFPPHAINLVPPSLSLSVHLVQGHDIPALILGVKCMVVLVRLLGYVIHHIELAKRCNTEYGPRAR